MSNPTSRQGDEPDSLMDNFRCTQKSTSRKRGRPSQENAKVRKLLLIRPSDVAYLELWALDTEKATGNLSPALERLVDFARRFAPKGEEIGKPRNEKGQWLPSGGTSKSAIARRKKREANANKVD